jgi:hypothetical protein
MGAFAAKIIKITPKLVEIIGFTKNRGLLVPANSFERHLGNIN